MTSFLSSSLKLYVEAVMNYDITGLDGAGRGPGDYNNFLTCQKWILEIISEKIHISDYCSEQFLCKEFSDFCREKILYYFNFIIYIS